MKVDLYDAPLSMEAERLLQDPEAVHDLLIRLMESGDRRHFEVKAGARVLDVTSSPAVAANSEA